MTPEMRRVRENLEEQLKRSAKLRGRIPSVTEAELVAQDRREMQQMAWTAGGCFGGALLVVVVMLLVRWCPS